MALLCMARRQIGVAIRLRVLSRSLKVIPRLIYPAVDGNCGHIPLQLRETFRWRNSGNEHLGDKLTGKLIVRFLDPCPDLQKSKALPLHFP